MICIAVASLPKDAIAWSHNNALNELGALLRDDMGLGKSMSLWHVTR